MQIKSSEFNTYFCIDEKLAYNILNFILCDIYNFSRNPAIPSFYDVFEYSVHGSIA